MVLLHLLHSLKERKKEREREKDKAIALRKCTFGMLNKAHVSSV